MSDDATPGGEDDQNHESTIIIPYVINQSIDLESLSWTIQNDDSKTVYWYDYKTDPMFGSPTNNSGFITAKDDLLFITHNDGGQDTTANKIDDGSKRLHLPTTVQYRLLNLLDDAHIIEADHPKYHEKDVNDMGYGRNPDPERYRDEIREQKHELYKITLPYRNGWVNVHFDSCLAKIPATTDAIEWFANVVMEVRPNV